MSVCNKTVTNFGKSIKMENLKMIDAGRSNELICINLKSKKHHGNLNLEKLKKKHHQTENSGNFSNLANVRYRQLIYLLKGLQAGKGLSMQREKAFISS